MFKNKNLLITGGTGSFGKAFSKFLLKSKVPLRKIIIFSRDEFKQHIFLEELKKEKFIASTIEILNLVIDKLVTGKDLSSLLSERNKGITDPLDPSTFPYLTTEKIVLFFPIMLLAEINNLSEHNLVAP